ncbi:MAG TPA: hypothetical protein VHA52_01730 [Candidatus Babeliaceae bacterium]|nr:hypothetical protein [Candidatus Babeliaceae bacterium]
MLKYKKKRMSSLPSLSLSKKRPSLLITQNIPTTPTLPVYSPITPVSDNPHNPPNPSSNPSNHSNSSNPSSELIYTNNIQNITPLTIANHPKLLRKVPFINKHIFLTTMHKPFAEYARASLAGDREAQHRVIVQILNIPGQTMISRRDGKKGKYRDFTLMHHRLIQQQLQQQQQQSTQSSAQSSSRIICSPSTSDISILRSIARSVALTREGHYSRAIQAISSNAFSGYSSSR